MTHRKYYYPWLEASTGCWRGYLLVVGEGISWLLERTPTTTIGSWRRHRMVVGENSNNNNSDGPDRRYNS